MTDERLKAIVEQLVAEDEGYGMQDRVIERAAKHLAMWGLPGHIDEAGNLLAGTQHESGRPCWLLVAHADKVPDCKGYDDKCGIGIILHVAEQHRYPMGVLLTTGEESGQTGSWAVDAVWLRQWGAALVLDRRGNSDLVTRIGSIDLASEKFVADTLAALDKAGLQYTPCEGRASDALHLWQHLPTLNISVGFHQEHTAAEWCDYAALTKAYHATRTLLAGGAR